MTEKKNLLLETLVSISNSSESYRVKWFYDLIQEQLIRVLNTQKSFDWEDNDTFPTKVLLFLKGNKCFLETQNKNNEC